jgi:hypothetical protein
MRRLLAAALGAALSVALCSSANALADDATPVPTVVYPMPSAHLVVQGEGRLARAVLADYRDRLTNVKIHLRPTCAERPDWTCLTVVKADYGNIGWAAGTLLLPEGGREVRINTLFTDNRRAIYCHEFGHVLGLGHHALVNGCLGSTPNVEVASNREVATIDAYYEGA